MSQNTYTDPTTIFADKKNVEMNENVEKKQTQDVEMK